MEDAGQFSGRPRTNCGVSVFRLDKRGACGCGHGRPQWFLVVLCHPYGVHHACPDNPSPFCRLVGEDERGKDAEHPAPESFLTRSFQHLEG